jgi:hypothetical protein
VNWTREAYEEYDRSNYESQCVYLNSKSLERELRDIYDIGQAELDRKAGKNFIEQPIGKDITKFNSLKYNYDEDYGFIKPYVRNYKYYGIKAEIHPTQMRGIFYVLKKKFPKSDNKLIKMDLTKADQSLYSLIKNWITTNISKIACSMSEQNIQEITNVDDLIKYENLTKFHKIQSNKEFTIIFEKLYYYGMTEKVDNENQQYNYKFVTKIYRENAEIYYNLYNDISFEPASQTVFVNRLNIIGISMEEDIHFGKFKKNAINMKDSNGVDCSMVESAECNTLFSTDPDYLKNRNVFLNKRRMEQQTNKEEDLYKCFYKNALTKDECESYELVKKENSDDLTKHKPGIWAKSQCTFNEECPYYNANQNYKNNRGGCVNGVCELPLNMKLITPTQADTTSKPLCHNCKNDQNHIGIKCLQCCDEQYNDIIKEHNGETAINYTNLTSPDYAFENDYNDRSEPEAAKKFEENGLAIKDLSC